MKDINSYDLSEIRKKTIFKMLALVSTRCYDAHVKENTTYQDIEKQNI